MPSDDQQSFDELLQEAHDAYHVLRLDQALAAYRAASDRRPDAYDAHLGIARTLARMRDNQGAHAAVDRCIALAPERFEAYVTQGVLFFLTDELEQAQDALQKAHERAPDEPESLLTLAQVYCDRGDFDQADETLAEARTKIEAVADQETRDQLTALAWHVETYRHLSAGNNTAAREAAQRVIGLEDVNPYAACLAYSNLGIMETRAKNYDRAIEYLERACSTNPHFHRAAGALARILIVQGNHARAVEILENVIAHEQDTTGDTHYAYAVALAKSKRRNEARDQFSLALGKGLHGPSRIMARWQTLWLTDIVRYSLISIALLALLLWVLLGEPSTQAITLLVLVVVILGMQRIMGQRR